MVYDIEEIAKDTRHPGDVVYAVVKFWDSEADRQAGKQPRLTEDFLMPSLQESAVVVVQDDEGAFILDDGTAVPADKMDEKLWQRVKRETVALDVGEQIKANIERHIATVERTGRTGDKRDRQIRPEQKQAAGISQRADVRQLVKAAEVSNFEPFVIEVRA